MNYQGYEKEIDLIDLCKCLLQKWKIILTVTLVGCLVGGIFAFTKTESIAKEEDLKEEEILNMQMAYNYQQQYNALTDYYSNSYIMKLDAKNVATSSFGFFIDNCFQKNTVEVDGIIFDEATSSEIKSIIGDCKFDLSDIITVNYSGNVDDIDDGSVKISLRGANTIDTCKVADVILGKLVDECIIEFKPKVTSEIIYDSILEEKQNKYITNISTAFNNASTYEKKLSNEVDNYYKINYLNEELEESGVLKYIVIGGMLAGIVICGYYALIYFFSNTIKTRNELSIYGIPEIAAVSLKQQNDSTVASFEYLDTILNRLVSKKAILSYEKCSDEVIDILSKNKKLLLSKEIYLDSSSLNEKCEGLILLIEVKKTNSKFIAKSLETCKLLGIQIIGAIIVQ